MISGVVDLVKAYTGYEMGSADCAFMDYIYEEEVQHILNSCNLTTLPMELQPMAERIAIGKFLNAKKKDVLGGDSVSVISSIKEGDTTVDFGDGTDSPEARLNKLIDVLMTERDLSCFRRLRW